MRFLRKVTLVASVFLMAFAPVNSVMALPEDMLNFYAQNNILFYDPAGCVTSGSSPTASSPEAAAAEAFGSLSGTQVAFVDRFHDIAVKNSINYGIPWEAVMAQGILESAAGTSYFATDRNNYFGINAVDSDPNKAYGYATPEKGWEGYYQFIQKNSNYRQNGAFSGDAVTDPYAYIKAIKAVGYATAPNYVSAVSNVIKGVENYANSKNWKSSAELAKEFPEWEKNAAANSRGASPVPNTGDGSTSALSTMVEFCSGGSGMLVAGGMTLEEAQAFMQYYRNAAASSDNTHLDGLTFPAFKTCGFNGLANCSAFSRWFVYKYTDAGDTGQTDGGVYANRLGNMGFEIGYEPRPYAVFSKSGHTGVVLGVDLERGKVVIGEASCGRGVSGIVAREVSLESMRSGHTYAYTDGRLKGL